ncbi:hypothetical protein ABZ820_34660 [Streptomyces diacarni]|uniref:hypothetical protein n=1 Tax=Streptomyces diacarni TaxID=2800381 RepID=UPI0033FD3F54
MAEFRCDRYPELQIGDRIRFRDGVCTTSDEEALRQLRAFATDAAYGITETRPPEPATGTAGRSRKTKKPS